MGVFEITEFYDMLCIWYVGKNSFGIWYVLSLVFALFGVNFFCLQKENFCFQWWSLKSVYKFWSQVRVAVAAFHIHLFVLYSFFLQSWSILLHDNEYDIWKSLCYWLIYQRKEDFHVRHLHHKHNPYEVWSSCNFFHNFIGISIIFWKRMFFIKSH